MCRTAGGDSTFITIDADSFSVYTNIVTFDWDPDKARRNRIKHSVSFKEAIGVFDDPYAWVLEDPDCSTPEETREWRIGESDVGILLVVYTIREPGPMCRIISALHATHRERGLYEDYKRI
jgi:uncharacterized protein